MRRCRWMHHISMVHHVETKVLVLKGDSWSETEQPGGNTFRHNQSQMWGSTVNRRWEGEPWQHRMCRIHTCLIIYGDTLVVFPEPKPNSFSVWSGWERSSCLFFLQGAGPKDMQQRRDRLTPLLFAFYVFPKEKCLSLSDTSQKPRQVEKTL